MLKSNKKIFIMIGFYTVILLAVIGILVFYQSTTNKNAVMDVWIATKTIQAGETVDDTLINNKAEKKKFPVSAVEEMEKSGAKVIISTSQITTLVAVGQIPAGQPLTLQQFEAVTPAIYGDYTSKTFGTEGNKWKFTNPDFIILNVKKENAPINGFEKGEEISIEGYTKYSYTVKNETGETSTLEGTYNGILTNKAVVHSLIYDESGSLTNIGVIVEQEKYPLISTVAKNGDLFFHSGYTEAWETTTDNQYSQLLFGHGIYTKDIIASPINLTYTENNETKEVVLADFDINNKVTSNEFIYPTFFYIPEGDVTLTTPYQYMTIIHYNLDGTSGQYMDATSLNANKLYNSKTGLYSTTFKDGLKEGYYEIVFGSKDNSENIILNQKVCFVIEEEEYKVIDENGLTLNLNFVNSIDDRKDAYRNNYKNYEKLENTIYNQVAGINPILSTKTENEQTAYIQTFDDEKLGTFVYTNIPGLAYNPNITRTLMYEYNGNTYVVKMLYERKKADIIASKTENGITTLGYTLGYYEFKEISSILLDNKDVSKGDRAIIEAYILNNYSKSKFLFTDYIKNDMYNLGDDATDDKIIARDNAVRKTTIKVVDNFKEAEYSYLDFEKITDEESPTLTFTGVFSKSYFKNLLVRGINLEQTISDIANMTPVNFFNTSVTNYGTFGNNQITGISVVSGDMKIQLFYSLNASANYRVSEIKVRTFAKILGVNEKDLVDLIVQTNRLSEESFSILYNSVLNENVLKNLNDSDAKANTEDLLKLVGFLYTMSDIDLTNLYTDSSNERMFNNTDLIGFIESLKVEFTLSNGEVITSNINVNK